MKKMTLKKIDQLLPHKPPMIMIDNYKWLNNDTAVSEKIFCQNDYGCENGFVMDSILIECIAQTVAAHYGHEAVMKGEKIPGIGMLVTVDAFDFYQPVAANSKIDIHISRTDIIGAFKLFRGDIQINENIVASGNIKVFNPEKPET